MQNPNGRPNRLAAALCAGAIALLVTFVLTYALLFLFGTSAALAIGFLNFVIFGLLSASLYTRAVDGPIRWRTKPVRRSRA
jgi:hypothetical protein